MSIRREDNRDQVSGWIGATEQDVTVVIYLHYHEPESFSIKRFLASTIQHKYLVIIGSTNHANVIPFSLVCFMKINTTPS